MGVGSGATLTAGDDSVTTTITAMDDTVDDDAETILVTAMLAGAQIGDQQTITITDDDEPVSTDATLSGLAVNDGTNDLMLTPTFASGTTSYTASVGNAVSQITVTPTKSDTDASVEYLDGSDATITDDDGTATGQQVDLVVGANTIKVKVTAGDAMTTETYTVTVTRQAQTTVPTHCDGTELWCVTMTVGSQVAAGVTYLGWTQSGTGALSNDDQDFDYDGEMYNFGSILWSEPLRVDNESWSD